MYYFSWSQLPASSWSEYLGWLQKVISSEVSSPPRAAQLLTTLNLVMQICTTVFLGVSFPGKLLATYSFHLIFARQIGLAKEYLRHSKICSHLAKNQLSFKTHLTTWKVLPYTTIIFFSKSVGCLPGLAHWPQCVGWYAKSDTLCLMWANS